MNPHNRNKQDIQDSTTDFFLKVMQREKKQPSGESEDIPNNNYSKSLEKLGLFYNYINQMIDKILVNRISVLFLSFLMASVLFLNISGGDILSSPTSGTTLNNVPVQIYGLDDDYEVTGVPENVQVGLIGPSLDIYSAGLVKDYEIYIDFTGLRPGNHTLNLKSRDFPDSLTVMILPDTVNVRILEKTTKTFDLGYQFLNEDELNDEYSVSVESMDISSVKVHASEETLNSIVKVDACIDVSQKSEAFEQEAQIKAFDGQGKEIDVEIAPSTVHVNCQVSSYSKTVPLEVNFIGQLPSGYQISNYTLLQDKVEIYGKEEEIHNITSVQVDVNVEDIRQSTTIDNLPLKKEAGINKFSVETVSITLDVDKVITKTFDQIPIKVLNLASHRKVTFVGDGQKAKVTVTGSEEKISALTEKNIQATINVEGLSLGSKKVKVHVAVDDESLNIKLISSSTITINMERN